jgi:dolichol-phosphate mannosyltransferase
MVVVLFMGSVQLLSLGIIGEYIRLIFLESKERPPYLVMRDAPERHRFNSHRRARSRASRAVDDSAGKDLERDHEVV